MKLKELKDHYLFGDEDAELLKDLMPLAEEHQDQLTDEFYDYLYGIPETAVILNKYNAREKLFNTHKRWFLSLFSGTYDNQYLNSLKRIGHAHVRVGLSVHYVNAAMNRVRQYVHNMIQDFYSDREQRRIYREAADKIMDMNLDVMTSSYREEEMRRVFVSRRLETGIIRLTERFTYGLNLTLVLALAGISISVVFLFIWDLMHIFNGNVEKGVLSALGELLILWMMIELLDNEIKNLKGGSFNILVFIGVIIVAMIREILISTLRHDDLKTQAFLAGTLLILGVVYYLVSRSQKDQNKL